MRCYDALLLCADQKVRLIKALDADTVLAKDIGVPPRRINVIVHGKRAITPDTALRLSHYFGMSERIGMNLQTRYDLECEKDRLADRLLTEVRVYAAT